MALQTVDFLADLLGGMALTQPAQHMVDMTQNKRKLNAEPMLRNRQESAAKRQKCEPVVANAVPVAAGGDGCVS